MSNDEWTTPKWLFEVYNNTWKLEIDAASTDENKLCAFNYTKERNGLAQLWDRNTWCNPPYSAKTKENPGILRWVMHAKLSSENYGTRVVMCLPADVSTMYFEYCDQYASEIHFHKRIKFGGSKNAAKFGTMIVIFEPHVGPVTYKVMRI